MSDWKFINAGRVRAASAHIPAQYATTDAEGFNGMFRLTIDGCLVRCVASDGMGWKHVSVSLEYQPKTCPSWRLMCKVKDLFWDKDEVVLQYHPAKKDYVNFHEGCLHLWQPFENGRPVPFQCPPSILVGPK